MATDTAPKYDPRLVQIVALQDRVDEIADQFADSIGEIISELTALSLPYTASCPRDDSAAWIEGLNAEVERFNAGRAAA